MRHTFLTSLLILMTVICYAKIWRVNNNAGVSADFTTAQAAHDGATAGDTIMFEPSATDYGNILLTKRLILIGPGYRIQENFPNYPFANNATVVQVSFNSGSAGSVISGMRFNNSAPISVNVNNVSIIRNGPGSSFTVFRVTLANNVSNVFISQNFEMEISTSTNCSNVIVSNNIIGVSTNINYGTGCQIIFTNNLFKGAQIAFNGQTLSNNIYTNGNITFGVVTSSNNIDASSGSSAIFGTANGNLGNLTSAQVFVGASGNTFDSQWRLRTGSPAIGAGVGGIDCGIFGGSTPYVLSGLPPIPALTRFITSGTGSNTTPLQVTVSFESKN